MEQKNLYTDSGVGKNKELFKKNMYADPENYQKLYRNSIEHRDEFWRLQAEHLKWDSEFTTIMEEDFSTVSISWFSEGKLNACRNALDVQIENGKGSEKALVYFTSDRQMRSYSYKELYEQVVLLANAFESGGLKAGDRVALYLPDCPETVFFMLACSRLGLIYVPIPIRFTAEITAEIVNDSGASMLVVSLDSKQESYRKRVGIVMEKVTDVRVINTGEESTERVVSYPDFLNRRQSKLSDICLSVEAEHPIFIIYANSAAGIPRGSVFATGGFLVQAVTSFDDIFRPGDENAGRECILCTLDLSSSAGQSYGLWGPLIIGSSIVISAEGEEYTCECLRYILDKCKSTVLLTVPGRLNVIKRELNEQPFSEKGKFSKIVCCGDTLTPRLITFAGESLTTGTEHVLNLWIQSESGTALINTYPDTELNRSGALGLPFPGIEPLVLNNQGKSCRVNESGQLVFASSWPAMIRTIWGQSERFRELYFQLIPGHFSTNDGVRIDNEGFFWFMGRLDDVIKIRGQSLATSEIEAVLSSHPEISETAVVSIGVEEGNTLFAFLVIEGNRTENKQESVLVSLKSELTDYIAKRIGEFAIPSRFVFTDELPRTHTGKVVRRILRRVATGDISLDEDLSHVANPESVKGLIEREEI